MFSAVDATEVLPPLVAVAVIAYGVANAVRSMSILHPFPAVSVPLVQVDPSAVSVSAGENAEPFFRRVTVLSAFAQPVMVRSLVFLVMLSVFTPVSSAAAKSSPVGARTTPLTALPVTSASLFPALSLIIFASALFWSYAIVGGAVSVEDIVSVNEVSAAATVVGSPVMFEIVGAPPPVM